MDVDIKDTELFIFIFGSLQGVNYLTAQVSVSSAVSI